MVDRRESISQAQFTHSSSHLGGGYSSSSSNSCPSFSSVLLDEIYRSIDRPAEEMHTIRKKSDGHANVRHAYIRSEELEIPASNYYQRACMVDKWMEAKKSRKVRHGSRSTSSSWDSGGGAGGFFSSSEAESFRSQKFGGGGEINTSRTDSEMVISPRDRRGFGDRLAQKSKTKLRALRIYGDLKKMKQPISPGRKLAGFLNSLFTAGNLKKKQTGTPGGGKDSPTLKSTNPSTSSSSASSLSRSCLSGKTPPSSGKSSGGGRSRTVSFFPMSAISDEEDFPNNNNNNNKVSIMKTAIDEELMAHMMKKNRRDFILNNYQRKTEMEEEEDAASCASSDLFELDNIWSIGIMERYTQELPVYETTHLPYY
ncbi:hypothetical protein ABFS83_04G092300 [Erythranthe nasuta]